MASAWRLALAFVLFLTAAALAQGAPPPAREIAQWIDQLGDNAFATRQKASRRLWEAGQAAESALGQALKSDDLEVRRRAGEILDKFRWGIYPDTPMDLVALIERYQAGDRSVKQEVVRKLFDRGAQGCAVLVKLATAEPDEEVRRDLYLHIAQDAARALPALLAENDFTTLETLLELSLALEHDDVVLQNYAVYWLLRDKIDERIRLVQARGNSARNGKTLPLLVYLNRAKGDLTAAREAAQKSGRVDLLETVLLEQGDWKALAKLADERPMQDNTVLLGQRVMYHRLAGDAAGLDKALGALREHAAQQTDDDGLWLCAKALLLNDRPQDAVSVLEKGKGQAIAFDLLCTQLRYREAFALVEQARATKAPDLPALEVALARTLYLLGKKDEAQAIFTRLGAQIKQEKSETWHQSLVTAEYRVGLKEQSLAHCAQLLTRPGVDVNAEQQQLLNLIFPRHVDRALAWWKALRRHFAGEEPAAVLKRVRDVLEGHTAVKDLESLAAAVTRETEKLTPREREQWLLAAAETCQAAGLEALEKDYLEKAAALPETTLAQQRLGDFLSEKKLWEQAAAHYGQAWETDRRQALSLYLQGWALLQSGADKEGKRRIEMAHRVPFGDEIVRQRFATALRQRGQDEAARREEDLLVKIGRPGSFYVGEAQRLTSLGAIAQNEFLQAAALQDHSLLRCLQPYIDFVEHAANLGVPHYIHRLRARGLVGAGRMDEAHKEIELCLTLLPGNADLPIQLLPALEKRGLKKEAEDVYVRTTTVLERVCADYPNSAWAHNNLAWVSACCLRRLDDALAHAREASELAPDNTGYLDTLAEVHFRRGEQDKAIEIMKKCSSLEPRTSYFRKQLKRFEAGDRTAVVPSSGGDD